MSSRFTIIPAFAVFSALIAGNVAAAVSTPTVSEPDTLIVTATRHVLGERLRVIDEEQTLAETLADGPFATIRKGASGSTDLYVDGFKRGDVTVSVDGERFTTACPNRMDTRVGQIDLLDIERVDLSRNGTGLQSGLGGLVTFRRRPPGQDARVCGRFSGTLDHGRDLDAALSVERDRWRLSGRLRRGSPWTDADGRTFADLYGFKGEDVHTIGELRLHRAWSNGDATASWERSSDLLFPYLLMDERENDHYQASVSHRGHRLYVNRTEHLMDNLLRRSANMSVMVTDATNTMIGLTGRRYELYARNWTADNTISPVANPAMGKTNHMLPDVWRLYAATRHDFFDGGPVAVSARVGLARTIMGDTDRLALYQTLHPDAGKNSWSAPFGVTASHGHDLGRGMILSLSTEIAAETPGIEQLYIAVEKPGGKPTWVGNPELDNPVRATLRTGLQHSWLKLEAFATRVWRYPELERVTSGGLPYQTYVGVDARIAGASLRATSHHLDAGLVWNWGEDVETGRPLSEIQPLLFDMTVRSPRLGAFGGQIRYEHATGQDRVDEVLGEMTSHAWDRVDLALTAHADGARLALEVENIFNELYTQHLSYLRNPFSAGLRVFEPGRVVRVSTRFAF